MAINLSTAGVTLNYAVETTAGDTPNIGTSPSSYTKIPGVKSIPELNPAPDNLETTDLEEPEWKTYIPGLKDPGGALSFTANLTVELMNTWDTLISTYDPEVGENKVIWFCIKVPGLQRDLYFTGQPSPLGMPAMEVSAVLETTLYITPTNAPRWIPRGTPSSG